MTSSDDGILSEETRVDIDDDCVLNFLIIPSFELMGYFYQLSEVVSKEVKGVLKVVWLTCALRFDRLVCADLLRRAFQ